MKPLEEMREFCRESLGLPASVSPELTPLAGRGSDRAFFRLKWDREGTAILVHYDPRRVENTYYAGIAEFLRKIEVPAPRVIRHDPAACLILMEDLGDTDLWSYR
jgi:aminoglycoside/choline kinase family phosphotransferase